MRRPRPSRSEVQTVFGCAVVSLLRLTRGELTDWKQNWSLSVSFSVSPFHRGLIDKMRLRIVLCRFTEETETVPRIDWTLHRFTGESADGHPITQVRPGEVPSQRCAPRAVSFSDIRWRGRRRLTLTSRRG